MDERQAQIKEGAGLEQSRVNQEFVDFLEKWGPRVLIGIAIIAGLYWFYQYRGQQQVAVVNEGFARYEAATAGPTPNPDSLRRIASDYASVRAVPDLAMLDAADLYVQSVRTGLRPGAVVDPETGEMPETEFLSDEEKARFLDDAAGLYAQVLEANAADQGRALIAVNAAFGLAAVRSSQGDGAAARSLYERAQTIASGAQLPILSALARERAGAETLTMDAPRLYDADDLPPLPGQEPPVLPAPDALDADGSAPAGDAGAGPTEPAEPAGSAPADADEDPAAPAADPISDPVSGPASDPASDSDADPGPDDGSDAP